MKVSESSQSPIRELLYDQPNVELESVRSATGRVYQQVGRGDASYVDAVDDLQQRLLQGMETDQVQVDPSESRSSQPFACRQNAPVWLHALEAIKTASQITQEEQTALVQAVEGDPYAPLCVWLWLAIQGEDLAQLEAVLPLALSGWACLTEQWGEEQPVESFSWFCKELAQRPQQARLRIVRILLETMMGLRDDTLPETAEEIKNKSHLELFSQFNARDGAPCEDVEVHLYADFEHCGVGEPTFTLYHLLFETGCVRWDELDGSEPADQDLMWYRFVMDREEAHEVLDWAAGLRDEQVLDSVSTTRFLPHRYVDNCFHLEGPLNVRTAFDKKSPLHVITLIRVLDLWNVWYAQNYRDTTTCIDSETRRLLHAGWSKEGPAAPCLGHLVRSFLKEASPLAPGSFSLIARFVAALLFHTQTLDGLDWTIPLTWEDDDRADFLEGLQSQIAAFQRGGHQPRSGIRADSPETLMNFFLALGESLAGRGQKGNCGRGKPVSISIDSDQLALNRVEGLLIPALRALWLKGLPLQKDDFKALMQDPTRLDAQELKALFLSFGKVQWEMLFDQQPLELLLRALGIWERAGLLPPLAFKLRDCLDRRCLQNPKVLDLFREEDILPPTLRYLWGKGLPLTESEVMACVLNPMRYPGIDWALIAQNWDSAFWRKLIGPSKRSLSEEAEGCGPALSEEVKGCGPVAVLSFLVQQLQGRPIQDNWQIAKVIVEACVQAPAALQPYRVRDELIPCLRPLWTAGLPMTRAEVFALFDNERLRSDLVLWTRRVKEWSESMWAALLMERGLRSILDFLNQRPAKDWNGLSLIQRRGLSIANGKLISSSEEGQQGPVKEVVAATASGSSFVEQPSQPTQLRLTVTAIKQIEKLRGLQADSTHAWLANAAVGWYGQERPNAIAQQGRSWLHAHVIVPGGGLCIVGYLRDRGGSACTVGWVMEGHQYNRLGNVLPPLDEETVEFAEARFLRSLDQEPSDETQSHSLIGLESSSEERGDGIQEAQQHADLWGAVLEHQWGFQGPETEQMRYHLQDLCVHAGMPVNGDASSTELLCGLELWLEAVIEEFSECVGAPVKEPDPSKGTRGTRIYLFQKLWQKSIAAIGSFFPGRERDIRTWNEMKTLLSDIQGLLARWSDDESVALMGSSTERASKPVSRLTIAHWMKVALPLREQLLRAGQASEELPLRIEELQRLVVQHSLAAPSALGHLSRPSRQKPRARS